MEGVRRSWGVVLLLAAAAARAAPAAPDTAAAEAIAAGDLAISKLDLEGARQAYRRAHEQAPESYEAAWKLARALVDEATLSPEDDEQKRLCLEAATLARDATKLAPRDSKGHAYLAIALGKLALFEGGKRKVELSREIKIEADTAIELNENEDLAYHVLGVWNREVAELSWLLRQFARVLYGGVPDGSLDDAVRNLRKASALRPDVIPHHVELAVTLVAAKRWAEAQREIEVALALPTGWVTDDFYRALARRTLAEVRSHAR